MNDISVLSTAPLLDNYQNSTRDININKNWNKLPVEIICEIFKWLNFQNLCSLGRVDRSLSDLTVEWLKNDPKTIKDFHKSIDVALSRITNSMDNGKPSKCGLIKCLASAILPVVGAGATTAYFYFKPPYTSTISNSILDAIYRNGWTFYQEHIVPTLASNLTSLPQNATQFNQYFHAIVTLNELCYGQGEAGPPFPTCSANTENELSKWFVLAYRGIEVNPDLNLTDGLSWNSKNTFLENSWLPIMTLLTGGIVGGHYLLNFLAQRYFGWYKLTRPLYSHKAELNSIQAATLTKFERIGAEEVDIKVAKRKTNNWIKRVEIKRDLNFLFCTQIIFTVGALISMGYVILHFYEKIDSTITNESEQLFSQGPKLVVDWVIQCGKRFYSQNGLNLAIMPDPSPGGACGNIDFPRKEFRDYFKANTASDVEQLTKDPMLVIHGIFGIYLLSLLGLFVIPEARKVGTLFNSIRKNMFSKPQETINTRKQHTIEDPDDSFYGIPIIHIDKDMLSEDEQA